MDRGRMQPLIPLQPQQGPATSDNGSLIDGSDSYGALGQDDPTPEQVKSDSGAEKSKGAGPSQATQLVELAESAGCELFHTPEGDAFARIPANGHTELWQVRNKAFRHWLARRYYAKKQAAPGAQAVQDALGVLEGKALYEGIECPVYVRLARHDGAIYLDLANAEWQAVKITRGGWQVLDDPPVRFRRPKGMLPLPVPVDGGQIEELRPYVNAGDTEWVLLLAFLVAALRPEGPYPVLAIAGEQGSAKSTLARIVRSLVDPNATPLRAEPRSGQDLMIAARNSWLPTFDNLSHIPSWLSDALCRLSTGGGFATRELYSDSDEAIFDAQRPVVLTSIEDVATRGDLLDRAIILPLVPIAEGRRRSESAIWRTFEEARPRILGALLYAVAEASRNLPRVQLDRLPRMADFAQWATAAEPGLGLEQGAFMQAYLGNRTDANALSLEAEPVAAKVITLLDQHGDEWQGTASELLEELNSRASDTEKRADGWPKRPNVLSGRLKRIAPNLRQVGIGVIFGREETRERRRHITIRREGPEIVQSVQQAQGSSEASSDEYAWGDNADDADDDLQGSSEGEIGLPGIRCPMKPQTYCHDCTVEGRCDYSRLYDKYAADDP